MRQLSNIDIEASIQKQKLVFDEHWTDKLNRIFVFLLSAYSTSLLILTFRELNFNNVNDKYFIIVVFGLIFSLLLYINYRQLTEKQLYKTESIFNKKENHKIIMEYAKKCELDVFKNTEGCIILNEISGDWHSTFKKTHIFIVGDKLILSTLLRDHFILYIPTLTSHFSPRKTIKKIIANHKITSS